MQVQTLQATRRKEEKQTRESLTVPLKKQSGLFADVAEVISSLPKTLRPQRHLRLSK